MYRLRNYEACIGLVGNCIFTCFCLHLHFALIFWNTKRCNSFVARSYCLVYTVTATRRVFYYTVRKFEQADYKPTDVANALDYVSRMTRTVLLLSNAFKSRPIYIVFDALSYARAGLRYRWCVCRSVRHILVDLMLQN